MIVNRQFYLLQKLSQRQPGKLIRRVTLMSLVAGAPTLLLAGEHEEYQMLNITAGQMGVLDNLDGHQRYGLEYRFTSFSGPRGFRLIPAIGVTTVNNGASFIYTDLRHDFYLNSRWLVIPSFGLGKFNKSSKIDLGNELEFRSGIELAYQFENKVRAGVAIFHLSNGGTGQHNPGTEALVFSLCIPVAGK